MKIVLTDDAGMEVTFVPEILVPETPEVEATPTVETSEAPIESAELSAPTE